MTLVKGREIVYEADILIRQVERIIESNKELKSWIEYTRESEHYPDYLLSKVSAVQAELLALKSGMVNLLEDE